jgi:hypothetical protein
MSMTIDRRHIADLKPDALNMALDEVLDLLTAHMKPKARERAKAALEAHARRVDTNTRAGRVVRLHAPSPGSAADIERAARADAIRHLIGRAF